MGHTQNTYCNGDCDGFKIEQNRNRCFWLTPAVDHSDHLSSPQRQQWRGKSNICNWTASSQTCNRNMVDIRLVFAYQSLILALTNSASKHKHQFTLFHQVIGFSPMLAGSPAEENLATFQTGAALAGVPESPSDPAAHYWERGKSSPLYLASRLQDAATPSQCQCWTFSELIQLASLPGTACFFSWICELNQLRGTWWLTEVARMMAGGRMSALPLQSQ